MNRLKIFREELLLHLNKLESAESLIISGENLDKKKIEMLDKIINTTAWLHHQITYIHLFAKETAERHV